MRVGEKAWVGRVRVGGDDNIMTHDSNGLTLMASRVRRIASVDLKITMSAAGATPLRCKGAAVLVPAIYRIRTRNKR